MAKDLTFGGKLSDRTVNQLKSKARRSRMTDFARQRSIYPSGSDRADELSSILNELKELGFVEPIEDDTYYNNRYSFTDKFLSQYDPYFKEMRQLIPQYQETRRQDRRDLVRSVFDKILNDPEETQSIRTWVDHSHALSTRGQELVGSILDDISNLSDYDIDAGTLSHILRRYFFRENKNYTDEDMESVFNKYGLDKDSYSASLSSLLSFDSDEWSHFTPSMVKGLLKSTNRHKAVNELSEFMKDHGYRFEDSDAQFDSLNSIRRAITQYQEQDRLEAERKTIIDYLSSIRNNDGTRKYDLGYDDGNNLEYIFENDTGRHVEGDELEALKAEALASVNAPYEYSDDVKSSVNDKWRLFESPEDQNETGAKLMHCYSNHSKYGTAHSDSYRDKIRSKRSILINKGDTTAEIVLKTDNKGIITEAKVTQVMKPNNEDAPKSYWNSANKISKALVGKNVNSLLPQEVDQKLSDICCKYLRVPQHLVASMHSRF